jgi:hypothetical protein
MWETLAGSLLGGIFRCIPEIMKFFDAKNERKHELNMQDKAIEFQKLKGNQRIDEIVETGQQTWNAGAIDTLKSAIESQFRPSGVKWVDALSTLMRPLITLQWVVILYPAVIIAGFFIAINQGTGALDALVKVFGSEEKALVGAILNFWFLGRVFDKVK